MTEQDEHLPCEIALSEYSLAEGVSRVLHGYVYPPCIPKGYGYEILRTAQDTHLLNEDSELLKTHAAKDYRNIVDEIVKFLRIRLGGVNGPKIFTFKVSTLA